MPPVGLVVLIPAPSHLNSVSSPRSGDLASFEGFPSSYTLFSNVLPLSCASLVPLPASQEQPGVPTSPSLQPPGGPPAHPHPHTEFPRAFPPPPPAGLAAPTAQPCFPGNNASVSQTTMSFHLRRCPSALWDVAQRALCVAQGCESSRPASVLGCHYAILSLGCGVGPGDLPPPLPS